MAKFLFQNAQFIKTALLPKDYPTLRDQTGNLLPEIAVAGRSNVGKSSLLNNLFQAPGLVKTSSTPGKTQALNFFTVNRQLAFVDLPGYGYAKVPQHLRKEWGPMIQTYLEERKTLKLILFLLDIRRTPNEEDFQLLNWILEKEKAVILVLTKADKLNQSERVKRTKEILEVIGLENLHYVLYSTIKHLGHRELTGMLQDALGEDNGTVE